MKILHRLIHGHKYEPNIVGYDRYKFDIVDGCKICIEKEILRLKSCYCVCHNINSSNAYCDHCKGRNIVADYHRRKKNNG